MTYKEKAWCVARRKLIVTTVRWRQQDAIEEICDSTGLNWDSLVEKGYRCVKVTVTEGWTDV